MVDNVFINDRTIVLSGEIDEKTVGTINAEMIKLICADDKEDKEKKKYKRKPIKLFISSPGGNVSDMWALIDTMQVSKTPIYTYCSGYAHSAAFMIFIAGYKRFVGEHAKLMFHQILFYSGWDKFLEHKQHVGEVEKEMNKLKKYVIERTKIPEAKINKVFNEKVDWYIQPEEAIKLGVADKIMTKF